ncbi:MAG: Ig-like domain repeat protein [Rhodanobacteraceae bacterium]|nr:Ig-like domain repeat protein [Rhodanobacteraceae bacterium]
MLNFTVTRTGITASAVGFNFATADNTATAGSDYVVASGTGTIAAGGATGSTQVAVTINGEAVFENNETFFVNLSAPTNATIADAQGVGTITNDDTAPTLAINDVSIVEGNSGTSDLVFTVTRTGLTALPASFSAAAADGTATAPSDYLAALVGSTTIAAGGATGTTTLTATINGDAVVEANETFFVNLSAPGNATIADNQGTGTINNDDTAGIVLVQSGGSTDVTEGGVTDSYTLVLTSQPTGNVSVALNPGTQVTVASSPVVFTSANWATPQTVTVTAVDDAAIEGPHTGTITHTVTSADATYNNFPVANVVANITDNDLPTLAINDVSISEGNSSTQLLTFTVTRTGTTASAVGFSFATANDTATTADSDYVAASGSGTIPSGGASATTTIAVTITGDATFENTESFFVNLTAPTNATITDPQGVGTITNDDTAPTLTINDVSITEGNAGTQNLVFTVTRTGLTALPASFTAVTADGTASAPSDYLAALAGSASIAAGGATGTTTLTATINGDFIVEANETFVVNLSASSSATIADNQGTGTITNDDTAGITVVQSAGTTNVTEGGATDTYTLVLTSQPIGDVSVALNGGAQVTPSPTPLLFTSGNWNLPQTVTVTAVDDPVIEGNHSGSIASVVSSSDGNYNGLVVAPVSVAITDNDTPGVTLVESGGNTVVTEGGATDTYTMVLTSQPSANVTVTPNGGTQLTNPPAVVFTNANWNLPQTVTVTATDDNVVEGTHSGTMSHTVASADTNYAGLVIGQVSASITDNDSAVVAFNPISVSQTEASSPMAFTVTLSNPVASGVTLTLDSAPGSATAADFTPIVTGTVSFAANSTASQTVNVVISNDVLDENDETFTLALTGLTATGNVTLGTAIATGTIQDDDLPPVISITSPSQLEGNAGNTPMNFVVSLSAVSGRDVSFTRATADGSATLANNDYLQLLPAGATILAGQTSLPITVQIVGDSVFEGNENFRLDLSNIVNATIAVPPLIEGTPVVLTGTGTILDDDQQPTTTTITSDMPDATVVGQPYTVAVNVAAVTTSPLGTVTISDGSASCGPVTLTTAAAPNSTASCALTSTSAGAKTLTASYTPASTAFAASSGTTAHQVNAASTAISVVGPARSRINQPTSFTFALSVNAPGAGSPAGTVTLTSGTATCNVTGADGHAELRADLHDAGQSHGQRRLRAEQRQLPGLQFQWRRQRADPGVRAERHRGDQDRCGRYLPAG